MSRGVVFRSHIVGGRWERLCRVEKSSHVHVSALHAIQPQRQSEIRFFSIHLCIYTFHRDAKVPKDRRSGIGYVCRLSAKIK